MSKSIFLQINNYLSYLKDDPYYNQKNDISVIRIAALIAFKLTKGHFLANGNKRIAFVIMVDFLINPCGFTIKDYENAWNEIYVEWKIIADIPGKNMQEGIDKIYNLVFNKLIKKVRG